MSRIAAETIRVLNRSSEKWAIPLRWEAQEDGRIQARYVREDGQLGCYISGLADPSLAKPLIHQIAEHVTFLGGFVGDWRKRQDLMEVFSEAEDMKVTQGRILEAEP